MKQTTIGGEFTLQGKGLHTGLSITARFLPSKPNSGIRFVRTDLAGSPTIPAIADFVSATERGTVIAAGNAKVSTIEHAMSALCAHGIDNCTIEVNAPEMPILDGSASQIITELNRVGSTEQDAERNYFVVTEKLEYTAPNGSSIILLPAPEFSASVQIHFYSCILSTQTATLNQWDEYDSQISAARTFVFVREIMPLLQHNLIKGGDLDNAIVIYDELLPQAEVNKLCNLLGIPNMKLNQLGYLNPRPLAFENEPARHKLLDIIGDLYLIGRPIIGQVIATKPGHGFNTQVAKQLLQIIKQN